MLHVQRNYAVLEINAFYLSPSKPLEVITSSPGQLNIEFRATLGVNNFLKFRVV